MGGIVFPLLSATNYSLLVREYYVTLAHVEHFFIHVSTLCIFPSEM